MEDNEIRVEYSVDDVPVVEKVERAPTIKRGRPIAALVIIGLCIVAYLLEVVLGATRNNLVLLEMGGKHNLLVYAGEYWRLVVPIFLHGSFMHLLSNMYALFSWGPNAERLFGTTRFCIIYMLSGIAGFVLSYALGSMNSVAIGASGAIFGVFGALLSFRRKHRTAFKRFFGPSLVFIIALNIVIGFTTPGVDNFGHIGGLIGGFLVAEAVGLDGERKLTWQKALFAAAFIAFIVAGMLYGGYRIKTFDWSSIL